MKKLLLLPLLLLVGCSSGSSNLTVETTKEFIDCIMSTDMYLTQEDLDDALILLNNTIYYVDIARGADNYDESSSNDYVTKMEQRMSEFMCK